MPTIRNIRPTDLVSLIAFFRGDAHREVTAQLWPEVWEGTDSGVVRAILGRMVTRPTASDIWVYLAHGALRGLAVAHPRAGKLAWDVEELHVIEEDRPAGVELLDHLCSEAAERGARRIFLAIPNDSDLSRIVNQARFVNYASESLYCARLASRPETDGLPAGRPRLRQDSQGLFQLYNSAVPCRVRSAEALTMDEWLSLEKASKPWAPSIGSSRQQYVWDGDSGLAGWAQLSFSSRSQHISLMVHPSGQSDVEKMLLSALRSTSLKAPVYATARDYQTELHAALAKLEFEKVGEYALFSREMSVRVPNRVLVPARA